ncbi:HNH endonuclease signature motif containing protein [Pseudomonas aeruginosa]
MGEFFETVAAILSYDPCNGEFTWKKACGRRNDLVGAKAGSLNNSGYHRIMISGKAYLAHRIAFLLMTGELPRKQVDHINGVRTDNRWVNLREVNASENGKNQRLRRGSKVGLSGVYWSETRQSFQVFIGFTEGGQKSRRALGRFKSLFEAACARKSAELLYGFHPNHGKPVEAL